MCSGAPPNRDEGYARSLGSGARARCSILELCVGPHTLSSACLTVRPFDSRPEEMKAFINVFLTEDPIDERLPAHSVSLYCSTRTQEQADHDGKAAGDLIPNGSRCEDSAVRDDGSRIRKPRSSSVPNSTFIAIDASSSSERRFWISGLRHPQ